MPPIPSVQELLVLIREVAPIQIEVSPGAALLIAVIVVLVLRNRRAD
jgi:hypothetical protein